MTVAATARGLPTACCLGDSISDPDFRSTAAWPYWLSQYLQGWAVQAHGVSGNTTTQVLARLSGGQMHTYEDAPYNTPPRPGKGRCYVLCGVNDLLYTALTAAQISANHAAIYTWLDANGWEPYPMTILPFGNSASWTSALEATRVTVNASILATSWKTINLEPSTADTSTAGQPKLLAAFDGGDGLHPGVLGAKHLAIKAALR